MHNGAGTTSIKDELKKIVRSAVQSYTLGICVEVSH